MLKFLIKTDLGDFKFTGRNHGEARDYVDQKTKNAALIYQIIELKQEKRDDAV
jgi:hypothetical protein